MKRAGIVVTIILALIALGIGFVGTTAALYVIEPSSKVNTTVKFIVAPGESTQQVAQDLQDDGLIRNALAFRLYLRFRHLDQGIQAGIYLLNPTMTMGTIVDHLQHGQPDEQLAGVPDGLRATQYPPYFSSLPNFNAKTFLTIIQSGVEPDGTKLSQTFWFVEPNQKNVFDALEGYLYPDHYYFDNSADATAVINKMIEELGSQFCPGPASNPTQYIDTLTDCKSHPAMVNGKSIFTTMEAAYHTKNDTQAIYDTLIIASLTAREAANASQAPGIAGVLWTRYAALEGYINNTGAVSNLGSDPSTQYALDDEHPPTNGKWWQPLSDAGVNLAKKDPYNNYSNLSILMPGPIANPSNLDILAAAAPSQSQYFYFLADHCGNVHYAKTSSQFSTLENKYIGTTVCSTSPTS